MANQIVGIIIIQSFFTIQEIFFKKTLGKWLVGLKIVDNLSGKRPTTLQLLFRQFAKLIPFNAFLYLSKYPAGLHESITGTRIVETENGLSKLSQWSKNQDFWQNIKKLATASRGQSTVKKSNIESLEKLFELRIKGASTEEEYQILKKNLLKSNLPENSSNNS